MIAAGRILRSHEVTAGIESRISDLGGIRRNHTRIADGVGFGAPDPCDRGDRQRRPERTAPNIISKLHSFFIHHQRRLPQTRLVPTEHSSYGAAGERR